MWLGGCGTPPIRHHPAGVQPVSPPPSAQPSTPGISTAPEPVPKDAPSGIGVPVPRHGDEIVAAGQFFRAGTPVVLWLDAGGYDGYRVERRFSPLEESGWERSKAQVRELTSPNRYGLRRGVLEPEQVELVRGGGWTLPQLQSVVDQLVLHFDVSGTSRECFKTLHDRRGLSIHFMLDLDGTIYQTLDLKEQAWHATVANSRSIGIEIAGVGAYEPQNRARLDEWYGRDAQGRPVITIPSRFGDAGIRTAGFRGRPARPELITGIIHGKELVQYDFTPEQYDALIRLTATLCKVFPKIRCDYPRDAAGQVLRERLSDADFKRFQGIIGHYHIQTDKVDPGPAFQWDHVIGGARRLMESH